MKSKCKFLVVKLLLFTLFIQFEQLYLSSWLYIRGFGNRILRAEGWKLKRQKRLSFNNQDEDKNSPDCVNDTFFFFASAQNVFGFATLLQISGADVRF